MPFRVPLKPVLAALALGILAGALAFQAAPWLGAPRHAVPPAEVPFARHAGAPARGAEILETTLDRELPPAPADAVAYDIREPLRNGRTVEQKSRWLWVPENAALAVERTQTGKLSLRAPAGTMFWKEFYLKTASGPRLVERRILKKVAPAPERNGGLTNGGWRFWTAHYLPAAADGVHGFDSRIAGSLDGTERERWLFKPDEWLPTRAKSAMTSVSFEEKGENHPYVFPGKTNCDYCHAGASATVSNPPGEDLLSFGIHPENMTVASWQGVVGKGWVQGPHDLIEILSHDGPAPSDVATGKVVGMLRNNCLSCHSDAPRAAARETAFVMDPARSFSRAELRTLLSARAKFMGALGKLIVAPGRPEESEVLLRIRGEQGRRRMPPVEGGVPEPDLELGTIVQGWIAQWNEWRVEHGSLPHERSRGGP